jgi:NAD(P)-dependent dehydrogenase (short-subunit alcohol dehydrogenase family)
VKAIITGASGTLGGAVEDRLLVDGWKVVPWTIDVTNALLVARDAQRLGEVDALICCAGSLDDCWRVNVMGTIHACKYVQARNIVTIAGGGVGGPGLMRENHPYVVSKFAVVGFTESVAPELARQGSVINCVSPGPFRSAMNPTATGDPDKAAELIAWLASPECKVTGRLFGAQHWKRGDMGGALRWTACE